MKPRWVADSAPLILLAKVGLLERLPELVEEVLIPSAVRQEIRRGPMDDPARRALLAGFGTRLPYVRPPAAVQALGLLGAGERVAITVAYGFRGSRTG